MYTETELEHLGHIKHAGICPDCFGNKTLSKRYGKVVKRTWGRKEDYLQVLLDRNDCLDCSHSWVATYEEHGFDTQEEFLEWIYAFTFDELYNKYEPQLEALGYKLADYNNAFKFDREGLIESLKEINEMPEDQKQKHLSGDEYLSSWNRVRVVFRKRGPYIYLFPQSYDTSSWSGGRYGY